MQIKKLCHLSLEQDALFSLRESGNNGIAIHVPTLQGRSINRRNVVQ